MNEVIKNKFTECLIIYNLDLVIHGRDSLFPLVPRISTLRSLFLHSFCTISLCEARKQISIFTLFQCKGGKTLNGVIFKRHDEKVVVAAAATGVINDDCLAKISKCIS